MAQSAVGSVAHLYGAYTAKAAGIELIHVPYRGSAPASQDFLGGQIDSLFDPLPAALPKLVNNQALAIAIAAKSRSHLLPDLPTFEEQGIAGIDEEIWSGLFGPARLPDEVTRRLAAEIGAILRERDVRDLIARSGEQPFLGDGQEFGSFVSASRGSWGTIIGRLGVKIEE